ncbi:unnamed protein product, partial [Closterium sp. Naga37s-1]
MPVVNHAISPHPSPTLSPPNPPLIVHPWPSIPGRPSLAVHLSAGAADSDLLAHRSRAGEPMGTCWHSHSSLLAISFRVSQPPSEGMRLGMRVDAVVAFIPSYRLSSLLLVSFHLTLSPGLTLDLSCCMPIWTCSSLLSYHLSHSPLSLPPPSLSPLLAACQVVLQGASTAHSSCLTAFCHAPLQLSLPSGPSLDLSSPHAHLPSLLPPSAALLLLHDRGKRGAQGETGAEGEEGATGEKGAEGRKGESSRGGDEEVARRLQYEDPSRQAKARSLIPLHQLEEAAALSLAKHSTAYCTTAYPPAAAVRGRQGQYQPSEGEFRDAVLRQLLVWFKSWFRWVDSPPCPRCRTPTCAFHGNGTPSSDDLHWGGSGLSYTGASSAPRWRALFDTTTLPSSWTPGRAAVASGPTPSPSAAGLWAMLPGRQWIGQTTCGRSATRMPSRGGCTWTRVKQPLTRPCSMST